MRGLLVADWTVIEPLGLLYLGGALKAANLEFDYFLDGHGKGDFDFFWEANKQNYDWVGFNVWTGGHLRMFSYADLTKSDGKLTIIGGPHATYFHESCLLHADYVVRGDGEKAIVDIVVGKENRRLVLNKASDPNLLAYPDRNGFYSFSNFHKLNNIKNVISEFGCPYECFAAGTPILMYNNTYKAIEILSLGDILMSYDCEKNVFVPGEITCFHKHKSDDLYRIEFEDGRELYVTGEHPFYTIDGWQKVRALAKRSKVKDLHCLQSNNSIFIQDKRKQNLFAKMQKVAVETIANWRTKCFKKTGGERENSAFQAGIKESYEKAGSCNEGFQNYEKSLWRNIFYCFKKTPQRGENPSAHNVKRTKNQKFRTNEKKQSNVQKRDCRKGWANIKRTISFRNSNTPAQQMPKQTRIIFKGSFFKRKNSIKACWQQRILDWSMPVWKVSKSRFYCCWTHRKQTCCSLQRALLAFWRRCKNTGKRLYRKWLESSCFVGLCDRSNKFNGNDKNSSGICDDWAIVKKITFVGSSLVYNLTISSTETFIANGLLVHNCSYCFNSNIANPWGRTMRFRTVDNVLGECKELQHYPLEIIYFQDDIFGAKIPWLEEFAEKYPQEIGLPFHCQMRLEMVKPNRMELLVKAGCHGITTAIESANPRIRKEIIHRGQLSNEKTLDRLHMIKSYGFKLRTEQMLGLPTSTIDDDLELLEWNVRLQPEIAWVSVFQPYLGAPLGDWCKEQGCYRGTNDDLDESFFDKTCLNFEEKHKKQIYLLHKLFPIIAQIENGHLLAKELISEPDKLDWMEFYKKSKKHLFDEKLYKVNH